MMKAIHAALKAVQWLLDFLKEWFEKMMKDALEKRLVPLLFRLLPTLVGIFGAAEGIHGAASFVEKTASNAIFSPAPDTSGVWKDQVMRTLSESLVLSQETARSQKEMAEQYKIDFENQKHSDLLKDARDKALLDSVHSLYKIVVSIQKTSATMDVKSSAALTDSSFENEWVSGLIYPSLHRVDTRFLFKLKGASVTMQNSGGEQKQVVSVFIQSIKDTSKTMNLGDVVNEVDHAPAIVQDESVMWIDHALGADWIVRKPLMVGISYTPFMITSGGNAADAALVRYPEISLAYDERSVLSSVGVRICIAHWIPLVQNIYVSPRVGADLSSERIAFSLAVGVRL